MTSAPAGLTQQSDVTGNLHVECGVAIVGSGAGGATMAAELADAGIDVVVIEEGGYHPTESFTADAPALRTLYRDGGGEIALGRRRCCSPRAGASAAPRWSTAACRGAPRRSADRWATERRRHGDQRGGDGPATSPGSSPALGRAPGPGDGRPGHALLKKGADAKGWQILPNIRNQLHCAGTNNCTIGCPTGAKRSMLVTYVPRALARGARLFADCRVDRITRVGRKIIGVSRALRPAGVARGPT